MHWLYVGGVWLYDRHIGDIFIGGDAEEKDAPVAGAKEVEELKKMIYHLTETVNELKANKT